MSLQKCWYNYGYKAGFLFSYSKVIRPELILLQFSSSILAQRARVQTTWQGAIKVNALHIALFRRLIEAQDQKLILTRGHCSRQTDSLHCLLIEIWFSEQVKQAVKFRIDEFNVVVNDAEEEAALEICLVREIVWRGPRSWHNDLDLGQREACLLEVRTVLTQDDLPLVLILLIGIKQCV